MRINYHNLFIVLLTLLLAVWTSSCADTGGRARSEPPITSCPPGEVLICESRQRPSKGGAEEEIPRYETCRCEPVF